MYRRNYDILTPEDAILEKESLIRFDRMRRKKQEDQFYDIIVEAQLEANTKLDEKTRNIYKAQQILKEKVAFMDAAETTRDKMYLAEDYAKNHKWTSNKEIINKVMSYPEDPDFDDTYLKPRKKKWKNYDTF